MAPLVERDSFAVLQIFIENVFQFQGERGVDADVAFFVQGEGTVIEIGRTDRHPGIGPGPSPLSSTFAPRHRNDRVRRILQ